VSAVRCPRCDAEQDAARKFCTRCGYALEEPQRPPTPAPPVEARFVSCPACGATNAASRRLCGRCGVDLREGTPPAPRVEEVVEGEEPVEEDRPGSPWVFAAVVVVAAVAILGVIATILSASGLGPFAPEVAETEPTEILVPVSSARASSVLRGAGGRAHPPEHLLDDDPTTTWRESATGSPVGEWVELQLEGSPTVVRLLVWNGDQSGAGPPTDRAARVRIDLGDRSFTADLLDVRGPQAIDLPEPVEASAVRLTVVEADGDDVALSGLEVRAAPAADPDQSSSESAGAPRSTYV
jgi:hypothetical protein